MHDDGTARGRLVPTMDQPLRVAVTLEQCWHHVPGGTARAALDLIGGLRSIGGTELIGVAARHRSNPAPVWTPTIPVAQLPLPRFALYELWHRFRWPNVQSATGPVDVIHVTGLATPPPTAPLVVTLHDLAFERYPHFFTVQGRRFFAGALDAIRRDADLVVCSSHATFGDARQAGIEIERLCVVPLGIHVPVVTEEAINEVRHRFNISGRYVLHLGTDEPRKNRQALRRIASRLGREATIVFAGGAGWGDTGASQHPHDNVCDLGFVSERDKHALLAGAAVFCFPSFWEGFGLPVAEAMAHGTPVVTTQASAMSEFTGDAAMLIDPHDDDAIFGAICHVLNDSKDAKRMHIQGRRLASELTWERHATAMRELYGKVAAQ